MRDDAELRHRATTPDAGVCSAARRSRGYEWLDLGGGDGTSHAPNVLATDIFRAIAANEPDAQPGAARRLSARREFRRH